MHVADVSATSVQPHLPYRLKKGQDFDVAGCATYFGNHYIGIGSGESSNPAFDLVGYVRDYLDRFAEVVPVAFRSKNSLIDRTCCRVRVLR